MRRRPAHLHIDKRIVRDVERIRDLSQKAAELSASIRSRAHHYDERENKQNGHSLVKSVDPRHGGGREIRHGQYDCDYCRCRGKSAAPHMDGPLEARNQESREERIKEARHGNLQVVRLKAPAANDGIGRVASRRKDAQDIHIEAKHRCQTCRERDKRRQEPLRETPNDKRIENIGDIFPHERPLRIVQGMHLAPAADIE